MNLKRTSMMSNGHTLRSGIDLHLNMATLQPDGSLYSSPHSFLKELGYPMYEGIAALKWCLMEPPYEE